MFDYLILGGGTAGCVLANRLSADPSKRVCLVEAGPPDKNWRIHVPAAVGSLIADPKHGWGLKTVPQPHLGGRQINLPRGKVLGGSSSTNGMVYNRGHYGDYDDWAALGNRGWSYREVLPYFKRSENNETFRSSPFHGVGGPMNVRDLDEYNPLIARFLDATDSLQLPRCADYNGLEPEGFGTRQATIRNGRRESEATAFLAPVKDRANLTVMTDALVRRVLIEDGRAVGAEIESDGAVRRLDAHQEVIVAGGSYMSPAILMRSGIGDAAHLQRMGIPVALDLPSVGRNLRDHLAVAVEMKTDDASSYGVSWKALPQDLSHVVRYLLGRRGPIAGNVFEGVGFLRTDPRLSRPDIQFVFMPARRNPSGYWLPIGHGYCINSVLLKPRSRGTVTLASADPRQPPLIDPNYLSEPDDFAPLLRAIRLARRILGAPSFGPLNSREILPGPQIETDEALKEYIRASCVTVHHPVSTCRMGTDPDAVVDPELRVRGIEGLRVVDASVFPTLIGGNTNATVVMIAEKAADLMLGRNPPPPANLPAFARSEPDFVL
jgi:choline dehydrogenase-like flavoprotein